jgi:hypothetical protein
MKKVLIIGLLLFAGEECCAQAPTSTVAKVEQRLAELLAPASKASEPLAAPTLPPRKLPVFLERPEVPLQAADLPPPAPPQTPGRPVKPRTVPEDAPLARHFSQPEAPQMLVWPTQPLLRLWSADVNEPLPLPILGTGVRDRASLDDPSVEASVVAAQATLTPARTQPVPFQPMNLPDPYEHRHTMRLRTPVDEVPAPPLSLSVPGR